ncbi:MAG: SURF1 family protein [Candidatus Competibacteraceae bacterium]|nr:SURF1 family protein [Candidatus Competibacteraceae bacterium]
MDNETATTQGDPRRFRPGWPATLAVLLLLPILLSLGFWQLNRARQKAELQTSFAEQSRQAPVLLKHLNPADPGNYYRRVIVTGRYDNARQLLLDNQLRDGQPGYQVFTPFKRADGEAILVNRGWTPLGESRQVLPDITVTNELVTVNGRIAQPANPGIRLGEPGGADRNWPRVIQYVDYQPLSAILGYPLKPAVILLDPEADQGYWRDWQPTFGGFGPERHQGYAVQWFALSAALVILYIAAGIRREPSF